MVIVYVLSLAAFSLQREKYVVSTETIKLPKLSIFYYLTFYEEDLWPLH